MADPEVHSPWPGFTLCVFMGIVWFPPPILSFSQHPLAAPHSLTFSLFVQVFVGHFSSEHLSDIHGGGQSHKRYYNDISTASGSLGDKVFLKCAGSKLETVPVTCIFC